jgi:hypothetical protein
MHCAPRLFLQLFQWLVHIGWVVLLDRKQHLANGGPDLGFSIRVDCVEIGSQKLGYPIVVCATVAPDSPH